ncbi:hypothetical protein [Parasutterella sp.]|uniref:hypothetical protein n=1 Tax=Parasutterella sp. TaxID=2049037 RepID=UPI0035228968
MKQLIKKIFPLDRLLKTVSDHLLSRIKDELQPLEAATKTLTLKQEEFSKAVSEIDSILSLSSKQQVEALTQGLLDLQKRLQFLEVKLSNLDSRISTASRKTKGGNIKKIVFLVHNIASIDALLPIIKEAKKRGHTTIVITINNTFNKNGGLGSEELQHKELLKLGIEHLRFGNIDSMLGLEYLKLIAPDVLFRQSPWDADIEEGYRTKNLRFTRLCYTPYYGVQIVDKFEPNQPLDYHCDQDLHREAWAIFVENSPLVVDNFRKNCLFKELNLVKSGLPKYEFLADELITRNSNIDQKVILWAPHHSFSENWLGFATFLETHKIIYQIASSNPSRYKFIFRPHPIFKKELIKSGKMSEAELNNILNSFESLPNFEWSMGNDPKFDFQRSDLLLTDGISFLASYMLARKPLIWLESPFHQELTSVGEKLAEATYRLPTRELRRLPSLLDKILNSSFDPLKDKREDCIKFLLGSGKPSEAILDYIETNA